ncbi:hypothetical protein [Thermosulfurimonas sp. F29]|uniref:hypothetical protein n=1 Tax=Thermosulfurimonas sp. F29 TaxID=2867247 RepID=UPI001C82EF9C|nr:hypothetical protein [Thermosulfurimonas sp. F29]MBX6423353.1 hypothetical protein [Thermosulfurimonas sp. F29]
MRRTERIVVIMAILILVFRVSGARALWPIGALVVKEAAARIIAHYIREELQRRLWEALEKKFWETLEHRSPLLAEEAQRLGVTPDPRSWGRAMRLLAARGFVSRWDLHAGLWRLFEVETRLQPAERAHPVVVNLPPTRYNPPEMLHRGSPFGETVLRIERGLANRGAWAKAALRFSNSTLAVIRDDGGSP